MEDWRKDGQCDKNDRKRKARKGTLCVKEELRQPLKAEKLSTTKEFRAVTSQVETTIVSSRLADVAFAEYELVLLK